MKRLLLALMCLPLAAQAGFETPAKEAYLYDTTTQSVLLAKNADERMGPSSMSKMLTVYIVFEKLKAGELKLSDTFYVSEKAWKMGGSKMFVKVGDRVPVEDLLQGVMIQSGNDACIVLAEGIAGTEDSFAEIMNVKAQQLGLTGSHFVNATGWPDENHYMTARDLGKLANALIRDFPEYYHYWSEREFTYNGITQHNRNTLLGELGVDGIKTGHTEVAGFGITTSAEQDNRRLIGVVNGLDSMKARIDASRELLTYGFKQFDVVSLFADSKPLAEAKTWYGTDDAVPLIAQKPLTLTLPKYDKSGVKVTAKYTEPVVAPIEKNQVLGQLTVQMPESAPITIPLLAAKSVDKLPAPARILPTLRYRLLGVQ